MKFNQLKTFEAACKVEGLNAKKVIPDFAAYPKEDRKAMIAHAKLVIIARAANRLANEGKEWKPDWNNNQWDKYYPWFWMNGGSRGFRYFVYGSWYSLSPVGSRLCFISRDVAEHMGKTFLKLYKEYFTV